MSVYSCLVPVASASNNSSRAVIDSAYVSDQWGNGVVGDSSTNGTRYTYQGNEAVAKDDCLKDFNARTYNSCLPRAPVCLASGQDSGDGHR